MAFITYGPDERRANPARMSPLAGASMTLGLASAFAILLLALPGFPAGRYAQDLTAILDGGYRIARGMTPHLDFSAPYGALILVQGWLAHRLEPWFSPMSVLLLSSFALVAPFAFAVARRQASALAAAAAMALPAMMVLLPLTIEYEAVIEPNYNGFYNRNASALILVALIWLFSPKKTRWSESLFLAALAAVMLFWKVSHAYVLSGILLAASLSSPPVRRITARGTVMIGLMLLCLDLIGDGVIRAYGRDIMAMIRANILGSASFYQTMAMRHLPALLLAGAAIVMLVRMRPVPRLSDLIRRPRAVLRAQRPAMLTGVIVLAVLAIESQNIGHLGLLPALALGFGPLAPHRLERRRAALAMVTLALFAYPYAETLLRRGATLAVRHADMRLDTSGADAVSRLLVSSRQTMLAESYAKLWRAPDRDNARIAEANLIFAHGQNPTEPAQSLAWAREVQAAADLARASRLITGDTKVMTIGYVEPFARILRAAPVPGGALWLDPQRTTGPLTPLYAARLLENADAVFVQLCPKLPALDGMVEHAFSRPLRDAFQPALRTPCYELWTRATGPNRSEVNDPPRARL